MYVPNTILMPSINLPEIVLFQSSQLFSMQFKILTFYLSVYRNEIENNDFLDSTMRFLETWRVYGEQKDKCRINNFIKSALRNPEKATNKEKG